MHKYKRAEVFHDDLDLAVCIIKLLTMISGNKDCRKKLVSTNIIVVRKLMIFDHVSNYRVHGPITLVKVFLLIHQ